MATIETKNNIAKMRIKDIPAWLTVLHDAGIAGMIHGIPGCGKTQTIKEYARRRGLPFHIILLSMSDPTDLKGIPSLVQIKKRTEMPDGTVREDVRRVTEFFPPNMLPDGPGVLCFDEINQGLPAVMSAAQSILLERASGIWKAHPELLIVATGNRLGDRTGVNAIPSAMDNRVCHCEVTPHRDDFVDYIWDKYVGDLKRDPEAPIDFSKLAPEHALRVEQASALVQYFEWKPGAHHDFDPGKVRLGIHGQPTWRTWEMQLKARLKYEQLRITNPDVNMDIIDNITMGLVGVGYGAEYNVFCQTIRELEASHPRKFMAQDNSGWVFPTDPSVLYAFVGALPQHMPFFVDKKQGEHAAQRFYDLVKIMEHHGKRDMVAVLLRSICRIHGQKIVQYGQVTQAIKNYAAFTSN